MEIIVQTGGLMRTVGWEEGSKMLRDAGFTGVDWNLDAHVSRPDINAGKLDRDHIYLQSIDQIREALNWQLEPMLRHGLQIRQGHAPFPPYSPNVPGLLDYMVEMYINMLPYAQELGMHDIVVHGIPWFQGDSNQPTREDNWELNMKLYEPLIPVLLKGNMRVCLENLFYGHKGRLLEGVCSDVHEAVKMVDTLNAKAGRDVFGFCVDTGHLNLLNKSQSQFIGTMGKRVTALHIHDNDSRSDQHMCPYFGNIDWDDFLLGLQQAGFTGDICFETFNQVLPEHSSREAIPVWLRTIHDIGETFRSKLV